MMSMSELLIRWNFGLCNWCFKDQRVEVWSLLESTVRAGWMLVLANAIWISKISGRAMLILMMTSKIRRGNGYLL